jgi:peptide/nickel transport system substrate-binding protein
MFIRRGRSRLATVVALAAVLASTTLATSGATAAVAASPPTGGTVTFAENQSAGAISYVFPLMSLANDLPSNGQFQFLQWEPLYWSGQDGSLKASPQLSLAEPPVYGDGNREVTIHLKSAMWSDGQPVTSRDVEFFINLARADKANWATYVSGEFPDDVASVVLDGPHALTLKLTKAYSPTWFTESQLSEIVPLPQHAWDKTSSSGPVGNADMTPAGAKKVVAYLTGQSAKLATYQTNPLWQVVDGPWHMATFKPDGYAAMVPNPRYNIGPKPTIAKFIMEPFSSDDAEANDLSTGALTYGYVPVSDLSAAARFEAEGYKLDPWPLLSISYVVLNFNNPAVGPALRQLYVRQAMESLIDQQGYLKSYLGAAGVPDYGPVPLQPANPYVSASSRTNPYPYSPAHATTLLKAHGWKVVPNGKTTCAKPGTGAGECGKGVAAGAALTLSLQYVSGLPYLDNEMQSLKSAMSSAGITVNLSQGSEGQVVDSAVACTSGPTCKWQAVQWGTPAWIWSNPYPTGEQLFGTGAGVNPGSYSDPTVDADISALQTAATPAATTAAWDKYQRDVATNLPVLWLPNTVNQVSAISTKLTGASAQNPLNLLAPSTWSLSK